MYCYEVKNLAFHFHARVLSVPKILQLPPLTFKNKHSSRQFHPGSQSHHNLNRQLCLSCRLCIEVLYQKENIQFSPLLRFLVKIAIKGVRKTQEQKHQTNNEKTNKTAIPQLKSHFRIPYELKRMEIENFWLGPQPM